VERLAVYSMNLAIASPSAEIRYSMLNPENITDDYSVTFGAYRPKLVGKSGERYVVFVRNLRPKYWIVYRDIAMGYLLLGFSFGLMVAAPFWGVPRLLTIAVGAVMIGYWIAYLQLFLHEGAHYNLASSKIHSDRLCDFLVCWLIGTTVAAYRTVHFQHHRDLGTTKDTEFTYFFPLNLVFLAKAAFGVRAIEVAVSRATETNLNKPANDRKLTNVSVRSILIGISVYGAIIAGSLAMGWWWAAVGAVFGIGMMFPFFGAVRQLLEHRNDGAISSINYSKQDQGAFTRLFPDDMFSATFGGAGFNRHLLHHWEPQVSYTNLPDLEEFLQETEMRRVMDLRRTTYFKTFRLLLQQR
jgi:fatty acid desaturase